LNFINNCSSQMKCLKAEFPMYLHLFNSWLSNSFNSLDICRCTFDCGSLQLSCWRAHANECTPMLLRVRSDAMNSCSMQWSDAESFNRVTIGISLTGCNGTFTSTRSKLTTYKSIDHAINYRATVLICVTLHKFCIHAVLWLQSHTSSSTSTTTTSSKVSRIQGATTKWKMLSCGYQKFASTTSAVHITYRVSDAIKRNNRCCMFLVWLAARFLYYY